MSAKDGGTAFPSGPPMFTLGMSLRDYFAGQALGGILASPKLDVMKPAPEIASNCYRIADAMIAERAKEPTS